MILFNQRGSIDLFYGFLCFSLLGLLSFYTLRRIQQWQDLKKNLNQVLCIKSLNQQTQKFIEDINLLNQVIAAENLIQLASLFFPATWLSQNSLAKIKQATKKLQIIRLGAYLYSLSQQTFKGCRFDPRVLKTPYEVGLSTKGFKRTSLGITKFRSLEWKRCHPLNFQVICSEFKTTGSLSRQLQLETDFYFLPRKL